jgi:hypothetical protein
MTCSHTLQQLTPQTQRRQGPLVPGASALARALPRPLPPHCPRLHPHAGQPGSCCLHGPAQRHCGEEGTPTLRPLHPHPALQVFVWVDTTQDNHAQGLKTLDSEASLLPCAPSTHHTHSPLSERRNLCAAHLHPLKGWGRVLLNGQHGQRAPQARRTCTHGTLHTRQAQIVGEGGEGGQGGCSHHGLIPRNLHMGPQAHIHTHAASAQLTTRSVPSGDRGDTCM